MLYIERTSAIFRCSGYQGRPTYVRIKDLSTIRSKSRLRFVTTLAKQTSALSPEKSVALAEVLLES
jgi:hypothetical protein